jgi:hypothetical protein
MGFLPEWMQQLADECPERDILQLEKRLMQPKTQVEMDRTYKAKQRALGIVRKTIQVPLKDWPELQAIAKTMCKAAK